MIQLMKDLPPHVLGITAGGQVTGNDYETILMPAVEEMLASGEQLRMLYQLGPDFTGFDLSAMIDDAKLGMKHLAQWDRIALVSDHALINTFAKFFGYMLPCEVRVFGNTELDAAKQWITEAMTEQAGSSTEVNEEPEGAEGHAKHKRHVSALEAAAMGRSATGHVNAHANRDVGFGHTGTNLSYGEDGSV